MARYDRQRLAFGPLRAVVVKSFLKLHDGRSTHMRHAQIACAKLPKGLRLRPAVYTEDMFKTTHDEANSAAVKAASRPDLNLVGLAMRAERKVIDKIVDGLKFHG